MDLAHRRLPALEVATYSSCRSSGRRRGRDPRGPHGARRALTTLSLVRPGDGLERLLWEGGGAGGGPALDAVMLAAEGLVRLPGALRDQAAVWRRAWVHSFFLVRAESPRRARGLQGLAAAAFFPAYLSR